MEQQKRTVLISTLGRTPQVLCETVWAMANQKEPIVPDEIVAVSMGNFAAEARESIFGSGDGWSLLLSNLCKSGITVLGKLAFSEITIAADSQGVIDDLRSVEDNARCANYLFKLVRKYTDGSRSVRVMFSLSGGRKSLSAIATSTMSLLARPEDMLIHLIADSKFEDGIYHFPRGGRGYSLFEVPFVRTRGLLKGVKIPKIRSFDECLQLTQGGIPVDADCPIIELDPDKGGIKIGAEKIIPEKIDACRFMLLWLLCTYKRLNRPLFEEALWRVHQGKIDAAKCGTRVPIWYRVIIDKSKIQPITKLIGETKELLAEYSSMDIGQIGALLFPQPRDRYRRNLGIAYPTEKLCVLDSEFSVWLKSMVDEIAV